MTTFVMSSAVETSLIIFSGKSRRFLGPSRTGVFARNDKEREGNENFARKLCDTK
jgi:hypothetical protein